MRVNEPDFRTLPVQEFDWAETVYGNVQEEISKEIRERHGKPVVTVHYVDAKLYHDNKTGRSVTGILHLCNQTLIELFSKCQACVQSLTFVAARIAVDQIVDLLCVTLALQCRNGDSSLAITMLWYTIVSLRIQH
jgi:hypothetical protein